MPWADQVNIVLLATRLSWRGKKQERVKWSIINTPPTAHHTSKLFRPHLGHSTSGALGFPYLIPTQYFIDLARGGRIVPWDSCSRDSQSNSFTRGRMIIEDKKRKAVTRGAYLNSKLWIYDPLSLSSEFVGVTTYFTSTYPLLPRFLTYKNPKRGLGCLCDSNAHRNLHIKNFLFLLNH